MLTVISPSKTLDFKSRSYPSHTTPFFSTHIQEIVDHMKTLSGEDLEELMKISPKLAALNYERYQNFNFPFVRENSHQALLAFKGDVYQGIAVDDYLDGDFDFAQDHLRILSGLYGLLRPLDLIQPYRLEMGLRLSGPWGKNIYQFWEDRITDRINEEVLESEGDRVLVNLASNEYFKAVRPRGLKSDLVNVHFKEKKDDGFKIIGIHAKRARGVMADFIIKNRINRVEELKPFDLNGYEFNSTLSTQEDWVFTRV
ncbi:MAG: peroxide stress protein YaaA [Desulfobacterium sp.]|jgi:cytoplasmic iron level regulating protein YaaA (DUF328/UPF0246 family)|nr:peroxide stress protein YaaA [Desulfobacterium sp.]